MKGKKKKKKTSKSASMILSGKVPYETVEQMNLGSATWEGVLQGTTRNTALGKLASERLAGSKPAHLTAGAKARSDAASASGAVNMQFRKAGSSPKPRKKKKKK